MFHKRSKNELKALQLISCNEPLDVRSKRPFQWLINLKDCDNLKQFSNMEQQKINFQIWIQI